MKKSIQRIFLFMLVIVAAFNINSTVYATNNDSNTRIDDEISSYVQEVCDNPAAFGFNDSNLEKIYIGNPLHSYEYLSDESLKQTDYLMYPIFSNNELIFFAIKNLSNNHIELTQSMVSELQEYANSKHSIAIIYDASACYVYDGTSNSLLTMEFFSEIYNELVKHRGSLESLANMNNNIEVSILTPSRLLSCSVNKNNQTRATGNIVLPVPIVKQTPYENICWAASVASIGNYITSKNYSAVDIAKSMYGTDFNQGAGEVTSRLALDYNYGISYTVCTTSAIPSNSQIYNNLASGYPLMGFLKNQYNTFHMVVIRGVNSSLSRIYLMAPDSGYAISNKTSGTYYYTFPNVGVTLYLYGYSSMY